MIIGRRYCWWLGSGVPSANCLGAYQAKGAASLAASYTNLANPGTYDLTLGTAPSWAIGSGWSFTWSSSQYLKTGILPTSVASVIWRYSGYSGSGVYQCPVGGRASGASTGCDYLMGYSTNHDIWDFGSRVSDAGNAAASGVICMAGSVGYWDGASRVTGLDGSPESTNALYIGGQNNGGTAAYFCNHTLIAVAIYSAALTAAQVASITAQMNRL